MATEAPSLIEYPSAFPIKVMGVAAEGFEDAVVAVALQFDPRLRRRDDRAPPPARAATTWG